MREGYDWVMMEDVCVCVCVWFVFFLFDLFFILFIYNKFLSLEARSRGLVRYTIILHSGNHTTVRLKHYRQSS